MALMLALLKPIAAQPYPPASQPTKVGTYPLQCASGGGYVYDEVLEYRVWYATEEGDRCQAFASYPEAVRFFKKTPRAEAPLVLVLQKEWIDEPRKGEKIHKTTPRISEWQVVWLLGARRTQESMRQILNHR